MNPHIQILPERKLIGQKIEMNFAENKTFELWKSFMPRRKEITQVMNIDLISMQIYPEGFSFEKVNMHSPFTKWAAVEVSDFSSVPEGMETFILEKGMYAVFQHKGLSTDTSTFEFIFGVWLPKSRYVLDNRPHYEILGEKYKNNDPNSEEDICIPI